jgi:predicted dehydrogenase
MKTVKVAVVGLGKMGLLHASILNTMPNVEIVALCDKSSLLLRFAKKLFKTVSAVNDIEKLVDLDVNSVYVTTPIPSHFLIVKTLLTKQMADNIFVEKTLASNWDKARELCESAQNLAGVDMVGYMKRFSVTFGKAKSLLNREVLGELTSFNAYAYSSDFSKIHPGSKKSASRGGVLGDLGSHIIDLAEWFFGDFEVQSASLRSIVDEDCEDSADFAVAKSGLKGQFHVSWCKSEYRMPNFGLSILGSNGIIRVDDYTLCLELRNGKSHTWFRHDLNDNVNFLLGEPEYCREDETFVNSILNGSKAEPCFKTASKVDYIIEQVKKEAGLIGD